MTDEAGAIEAMARAISVALDRDPDAPRWIDVPSGRTWGMAWEGQIKSAQAALSALLATGSVVICSPDMRGLDEIFPTTGAKDVATLLEWFKAQADTINRCAVLISELKGVWEGDDGSATDQAAAVIQGARFDHRVPSVQIARLVLAFARAHQEDK